MSLNRHNTWTVISRTCQDPFIQSSQQLLLFFYLPQMLFRCWLQDVVKQQCFPSSHLTPLKLKGIFEASVLQNSEVFFFPTFFTFSFFFFDVQVKKTLLTISGLSGWNTACRRSHWLECGGEECSMSNRQQVEGWERWRWVMRKMGRHQRWPASVGIAWLFAATSHLALEAQTTISGNPAGVLLSAYTKMVWPISTTSTKRSPTQHDTRCPPSGWSQTILDVKVLGWCGFTQHAVVKLPNSLKCLRRQIVVEKWPFKWGATALVDVLAVSMPTAHSRLATLAASCCALLRGQPEVHLCNNLLST